jgi:hypothetical protein
MPSHGGKSHLITGRIHGITGTIHRITGTVHRIIGIGRIVSMITLEDLQNTMLPSLVEVLTFTITEGIEGDIVGDIVMR